MRIPGQVVVDDEGAELEVDALGGGLGGDHDLRAGAIVLAEVIDQGRAAVHLGRAGDAIRALEGLQPALVDGDGFFMGVGAGEEHQLAGVAVGGEKAMQVFLGTPGFGEDDGLTWGAQFGHLVEA